MTRQAGNLAAILLAVGARVTSQGQTTLSAGPECKAFPGSPDWPAEQEWRQLNQSLSGALLAPTFPASACYAGPDYDAQRCDFLVNESRDTRFWLDDPLAVLTQWPQGSTCVVTNRTEGKTCTRGGYPTYVVNATTAKHVQVAVDFAREKNVRVVVKNTGHDFNGRSVGAGALSIWVHHMKEIEFLPAYTSAHGEYSGMAVRFGGGLEAWEMYNYMAEQNITVVAPGGTTVGMGGGWFGFGGHSSLTSLYGLGSDQALEVEVVTANGTLLTASPDAHPDLFWALRGAGGGTYGVVTSLTFKAYPALNMTTSSLAFGVGNGTRPHIVFLPPPTPLPAVDGTDAFWRGVRAYYRFGRRIVDRGGIGFSFVYPRGDDSFTFITQTRLPGLSPADARAFLQPLYDELNGQGIEVANPEPETAPYGTPTPGTGDFPRDTWISSRLLPRAAWAEEEEEEDDGGGGAQWVDVMDAVRHIVEAGYELNGIVHGPSTAVAGWPGRDSAVNPAWRAALLHALFFEVAGAAGLTGDEFRRREARREAAMDRLRRATPGSGAYLNEAYAGEPPDWRASFYGAPYARLGALKRAWDPAAVFWTPTTPGSEAWAVRPVDGLPLSQNGRLCRARDGE